jgi:hypothetical protein
LGRILDGFLFVLDGLAPLDISVDLTDIFPVQAYQNWKLSLQFWEQNINIRRSMVSSAWVSITDSAASRDGDITDNSRARVPAGEFIRSNAQLPGMGPLTPPQGGRSSSEGTFSPGSRGKRCPSQRPS